MDRRAFAEYNNPTWKPKYIIFLRSSDEKEHSRWKRIGDGAQSFRMSLRAYFFLFFFFLRGVRFLFGRLHASFEKWFELFGMFSTFLVAWCSAFFSFFFSYCSNIPWYKESNCSKSLFSKLSAQLSSLQAETLKYIWSKKKSIKSSEIFMQTYIKIISLSW